MIIKIRQSISGTEYWDTEKKKTIFVPKGKQPDFEVTDNHDSIVIPEKNKVTISNFYTGQRITGTIKGEVFDSDGNTGDDLDGESVGETNEELDIEATSELDSMTIKQLRDYAKKNNIDIPSAIKVKGDIIALINDSK